jgi:hypothetical protein
VYSIFISSFPPVPYFKETNALPYRVGGANATMMIANPALPNQLRRLRVARASPVFASGRDTWQPFGAII